MFKNIGLLVLLVLAGIVAKSFLFVTFIQPRMGQWQGVPSSWGLLLAVPFIIAALVVGWRSGRIREIPALVLVATGTYVFPQVVSGFEWSMMWPALVNSLSFWTFWISFWFGVKKTIDLLPFYQSPPAVNPTT